MLMSMTGYGRSERQNNDFHCVVEARSVNHRYCEVSIRLPRALAPLENKIREVVRGRFSRGRFDLAVSLNMTALAGQGVQYNRTLAWQYRQALEALQTELQLPGIIDLGLLVQFRDILQIEETTPDLEAVWALIFPTLEEALTLLLEMRKTEGEFLATDITQRLSVLEKYSHQIAERIPLMIASYRERLHERITQLLGEVELDPNRLAQEVVIFAERSDISEELTRLASHIQEFRSIMTSPEAVGRKLDFLLQEMHREINTIGSKASDALIAQVIVQMKSELEKIREQVQNIE